MRPYIVFFLTAIILFSCKQPTKTGVVQEKGQTPQNTPEETAQTINQELQTINPPVQGKSHLPRLKANEGKIHITWVEQHADLAILKYAYYDTTTWSEPRTITSGTDWFVNWADFPSLEVMGDKVLTNILQKSAEGTYDYDVKLNIFDANIPEQTASFLLNTDGINAEHGFVSASHLDGRFIVSWLDGRNTKNDDPSKNEMTLRSAFVDNNGSITQETEIDARVCDCCNTATAITNNGPIVVYRDRSETNPEIRDIATVRWVNGKWTAPMVIGNDNWQLNGCPVNGPAIDTYEEKVVVSWFTAADDDPRVMTAFSITNGEKFGAPIRVDSGNAIGRVDADFLKDGSALVSWLEPKGENVVLQVTRVYKDGHHDPPITIANTSAERQSGFPQLEVLGDEVFVAWTDLDGDRSEVEMVRFGIK